MYVVIGIIKWSIQCRWIQSTALCSQQSRCILMQCHQNNRQQVTTSFASLATAHLGLSNRCHVGLLKDCQLMLCCIPLFADRISSSRIFGITMFMSSCVGRKDEGSWLLTSLVIAGLPRCKFHFGSFGALCTHHRLSLSLAL